MEALQIAPGGLENTQNCLLALVFEPVRSEKVLFGVFRAVGVGVVWTIELGISEEKSTELVQGQGMLERGRGKGCLLTQN